MPRFRERILEIDAEQFHHPDTAPPMVKFEQLPDDEGDRSKPYVLTPNRNRLYLEPGDWIISEKGGYRVMKNAEFVAAFVEI